MSLLSLFSGCYSHRTSDEGGFEFPPLAPAIVDAGGSDAATSDSGAVTRTADAGVASRCTGTDAISLLLCNLTNPTGGGSSASTTPNLTSLLDSAGGLSGIASILAAFTGNTGTTMRPTTGTTTQPSLVDLINLAGGLANIATLLNGLGGATAQPAAASNPIADLIAAFAQTSSASSAAPSMSNASPTLTDWLNGLGLSTSRAKSISMVSTPTASDCAVAVDESTVFVCRLQAAHAATTLAD